MDIKRKRSQEKKRNEGGGGAQGRSGRSALKWRQKEREKTWGVKKGRITQEENMRKKKKTNGRECERVGEASPLLSEAAGPIHLQFPLVGLVDSCGNYW